MRKHAELKTSKIVIGEIYFLSEFYDKDGAMVEVLSKPKSDSDWNTSVEYKVLEKIGTSYDYYYVGKIGICGGQNLYKNRSDASAEAKWGKVTEKQFVKMFS